MGRSNSSCKSAGMSWSLSMDSPCSALAPWDDASSSRAISPESFKVGVDRGFALSVSFKLRRDQVLEGLSSG